MITPFLKPKGTGFQLTDSDVEFVVCAVMFTGDELGTGEREIKYQLL